MMATDETVRTRAEEMAGQLESAERADGGRYVRLRDGCPEWMRDVAYQAHGGMTPDDWVYRRLPALLDAIGTGGDLTEAADGCPDTYHADMLAWLGNHGRWGRVDDVLRSGKGCDLESAIQWAQYEEATDIAHRLTAALRAPDWIYA